MKFKNAAGGAVGVLASCGLILWSYTHDVSSSGMREAEPPVTRVVKTARVERLTTGPSVRLSAVTRPSAQSRISFSVGGRILKRPVDVGDRLKKGDVVAKLDPKSLLHAVKAGEAAINELEIRLAQAGSDSDRMARLAGQGVVTQSAEENARSSRDALVAAKEAAAAGLSEAKHQLRESVLRAPFDCAVAAVLAEPGEVVGPGMPIVLLEGDKTFEVEVAVPESLIGNVETGAQVPVDLPLVGVRGLVGEVTNVAGSAMGAGGLFPVTVTLPKTAGIRGGLTAEVVLLSGPASGLGVPLEAVINPSGKSASVLKVENSKAQRAKVVTHDLVEDRIAVTGDVQEGDEVIVAGHQQLLGGEAVEIVP